jgi:hypothetical protein
MTMNKLAAIVLMYMVGQISCLIIDGMFLGTADGGFMSVINSLMGFNVVSEGGFNVIQAGIGFVTVGIPKLLFWNYSFLDGGFFIVRIFLFVITIAGIYGLWQTLRGQ